MIWVYLFVAGVLTNIGVSYLYGMVLFKKLPNSTAMYEFLGQIVRYNNPLSKAKTFAFLLIPFLGLVHFIHLLVKLNTANNVQEFMDYMVGLKRKDFVRVYGDIADEAKAEVDSTEDLKSRMQEHVDSVNKQNEGDSEVIIPEIVK